MLFTISSKMVVLIGFFGNRAGGRIHALNGLQRFRGTKSAEFNEGSSEGGARNERLNLRLCLKLRTKRNECIDKVMKVFFNVY